MSKYLLALTTEGHLCEVMLFKTEEERTAYARGFTDGGNEYGAGSCIGWKLPEELDEIRVALGEAGEEVIAAIGRVKQPMAYSG